MRIYRNVVSFRMHTKCSHLHIHWACRTVWASYYLHTECETANRTEKIIESKWFRVRQIAAIVMLMIELVWRDSCGRDSAWCRRFERSSSSRSEWLLSSLGVMNNDGILKLSFRVSATIFTHALQHIIWVMEVRTTLYYLEDVDVAGCNACGSTN